MAAREVSGDPAADRLADVLLRADDDSEHDHDGGREAMVETVREVVIIARLGLRNTADHSYDLVHLCCRVTASALRPSYCGAGRGDWYNK